MGEVGAERDDPAEMERSSNSVDVVLLVLLSAPPPIVLLYTYM